MPEVLIGTAIVMCFIKTAINVLLVFSTI